MGKRLYGVSVSQSKRLVKIEGGGHAAPFKEEYRRK